MICVGQVTALRTEVERLSKDCETTRVERDKVLAFWCSSDDRLSIELRHLDATIGTIW